MKNFKFLCALLLTALTFAACSNDGIITPEPSTPQTADEGIPFRAVFGVKNGTSRALSDPDNGTLTASWALGEQIAIVFGGNKYTAEVTEVDDDGNATVTATLPSSTPNNQAATFIYPASAANGSGLRSDILASQDGTLETLSKKFDVATAEGRIIIDDGTAQPNGTVSLKNQFAICNFQFKDENGSLMNTITKVTITDLSTSEIISVRTPSLLSDVYVAMKPSKNSTKFEVDNCLGIYQKTSNANLRAGKFYRATLTASLSGNSPRAIPFTFEAKKENTVVEFDNKSNVNLQYSKNDGEWTDCSAGVSITLEAIGDKVSFRGDNTIFTDGMARIFSFGEGGEVYIYGNIMSLLESTTFATATELKAPSVFHGLFWLASQLYSHPTEELLLPATSLTPCCYQNMFVYCTNLTKAPDLPATTLANACYSDMFLYCTNLTKAPDLPATTLVDNCYSNMFSGCTNLTSVKCLATNLSAPNCTTGWLDEVATIGTFTKAAGVSWSTGFNGIPDGWTVLEE
jgi:hypothetical protein